MDYYRSRTWAISVEDPEGYVCTDWSEELGDEITLCTPDDGHCECSAYAMEVGAETECANENEHGSCPGTRACMVTGLTECSGQIPSAEECNGEDENCDGESDESYPDTDSDGEADCLDLDDDNCPLVANLEQDDFDLDEQGDACDQDVDGDGSLGADDCNDLDPENFPGNEEVCDGQDNDCQNGADFTRALRGSGPALQSDEPRCRHPGGQLDR